MVNKKEEYKFTEVGRGSTGGILSEDGEVGSRCDEGSAKTILERRISSKLGSTLDQVDVRSLPSLDLSQRKKLPNCGAVYVVFSASGECLYVGKTNSLVVRWLKHHRIEDVEKYLDAKIAWLECSDPELLEVIECFFIDKLAPILNKTTGGSRKYNSKRKSVFTVRFHPRELEALQKEAKEKQVSIAEVIRSCVLQTLDSPVLNQ